MIAFTGCGIVVDIEGTTSSIRFVYDVLFPYAREHVADFLIRRGDELAVKAACEQIASDPHDMLAEIDRLMKADSKTTGLKALQGLIWEEGYAAGTLQSHVYDDVPPALAEWNRRGFDVRVYSSGSVAAQHAFFRHTIAGDLVPHFRGHYDTTTGGKRETDSYRRIASDMGLSPDHLLFLSDVPTELDAAAAAGWATALVVRPGNAPVDACSHPRIASFAEVLI